MQRGIHSVNVDFGVESLPLVKIVIKHTYNVTFP
jgi:hypothetical protein